MALPFVQVLTEVGIIPGIKVDTGAKDLAGHPREKVTEGLDGLPDRLKQYFLMGPVSPSNCGYCGNEAEQNYVQHGSRICEKRAHREREFGVGLGMLHRTSKCHLNHEMRDRKCHRTGIC